MTVIGIITESDFMRVVTKERVSPDEIKVYQMMSGPVITIDSDSPVMEAVELMWERKIGSLPVLEGDRFVGVLSSVGLMKAMASKVTLTDSRSAGDQEGVNYLSQDSHTTPEKSDLKIHL